MPHEKLNRQAQPKCNNRRELGYFPPSEKTSTKRSSKLRQLKGSIDVYNSYNSEKRCATKLGTKRCAPRKSMLRNEIQLRALK